ncbi:hypothetical protein M2T28_14440 [Elizabethkingia miricola]|uniref:hypothetical protein n=1 Tax=Elizabethkingia miricola TaxID=172045 RepID=UPI002018D6F8|nr:hypothetical protein [Elizabethkingia miricola]MCL1653818.1 hypothetical protein [Elizabethkingia miricola]
MNIFKKYRIKLWAISLWCYIWYKPHYVLHVEKDDDEEYEEHRYYVKKRVISWILLFPIAAAPLFIYGGLKALFDYFAFIFTWYKHWITVRQKEIDFKTKLDIVRRL